MFRFLLLLFILVPTTAYCGLRILWAVYRSTPEAASCICHECPRAWARRLLRWAASDVVLENEHVIDPDRPQILVANHSSWFDILALTAYLPGRTLFVAKQELGKIPVFGRAARACGHIFIDRYDRNRAVDSLAAARKILEEESPTVIMFPEGTRSATGELMRFKKGAFVLAIQTGVDVVPVAISGSREILRKGSLMVHPGTIRVRFGEPIRIEGLDLDHRNELTDRAHAALVALGVPNGLTDSNQQ